MSLEDTFDPWISEKKALDLKINAEKKGLDFKINAETPRLSEKKGLDLKINAETPRLSEKKGLDLKINAETPRLSEKKGLDLKINTELPPKEGDREGSGFRGYAEYSDEIEGGFGGGRGEETGRWKEEDVWDQSSENAWKIPSPYELDYDDGTYGAIIMVLVSEYIAVLILTSSSYVCRISCTEERAILWY